MSSELSTDRERTVKASQAKTRRRTWLAGLFVLAAVVLMVLAWPMVRVHLQSMAVLDRVSGKPVPRCLRHFVSEPIQVRDLELPLQSGTVRARLYTPVRPANAPALLLVHGVHHLGIDEPRLETFATAMAASGIQVLTPELPDIKDYHVSPESITTIGESAVWLARERQGRPVGVLGLSFSGGLALLAAANPKYQPDIKFVVAVGSQDEMGRVAEFYETGEDARPDGTVEKLPPHDYGALVLEYEHLDEFVPAGDLAPVRAVLRAHLYEDPAGERAAMAQLSPAQSAEARALMNTTLPATRAELERSNARHAADMAAVSPHGRLATLKTPVYLLHGAGDNVIPSAETEWIASELPKSSLKAVLISPVLSHLNLDGAEPSTMDQWRLVHFFARVLRAAEVQ